MIKLFYYFILTALIISTDFLVIAQNKKDNSRLNLMVDYARFKKDSDNSYLELYYAYSQKLLKRNKISEKEFTELFFQILITNKGNNNIEVNRKWNIRNIVNDSLLNINDMLLGLNRFVIGSGLYSVVLYYRDLNNTILYDSIQFDIASTPFQDNMTTLSDLEICSSIKPIEKDTNNIFYKSSYEVIPNPVAIVNASYPLFGYYLECYNLQKNILGSNLLTKYRILDIAGKEVLSKNMKKELISNLSVEAGIVNLKKLSSGSYTFHFAVLDSNQKTIVEKERKFYIYDPNKKTIDSSTLTPLMSDYILMNEDEIQREFSQAVYIATDIEKVEFKKMSSIDARRNYLVAFWERREKDEFNNKTMYLDRIKIATEKYHTKFQEGWKTDRGRICALYGKPEESHISRGREDETGLQYEVWFLPEIKNGTYFIFLDESRFANYRLVHSTHPNEIHNEKWATLINK